MGWWKGIFGESVGTLTAGHEEHSSTRLIEDIVKDLRGKRSGSSFCYLALFGDRPLAGKMGSDESIMIFTREDKARSFITGYQQYYRTTKPLSVLTLGSAGDLWAMLNNPSSDPLYKPPYGLIINFSYSGGKYNTYGIQQLEVMGREGLTKGLDMIS